MFACTCALQSLLASGVDLYAPAEGFYRADDDEELQVRGKKKAVCEDSSEEEEAVWRCEACSKSFKVGDYLCPFSCVRVLFFGYLLSTSCVCVCGVCKCVVACGSLSIFCLPASLQSDKQLANHEKSRKHIDAVEVLKRQFEEEDRAFAEEEGSSDGSDSSGAGSGDEVSAAVDAPIAAPSVDATHNTDSDDADVHAVTDSLAHVELDATAHDDNLPAAPDASAQPVDTVQAYDSGSSSETETVAVGVEKVSAKQKREARKAKKAEKLAKGPSAATVAAPADDELTCGVCHQPFPSRNKREYVGVV